MTIAEIITAQFKAFADSGVFDPETDPPPAIEVLPVEESREKEITIVGEGWKIETSVTLDTAAHGFSNRKSVSSVSVENLSQWIADDAIEQTVSQVSDAVEKLIGGKDED